MNFTTIEYVPTQETYAKVFQLYTIFVKKYYNPKLVGQIDPPPPGEKPHVMRTGLIEAGRLIDQGYTLTDKVQKTDPRYIDLLVKAMMLIHHDRANNYNMVNLDTAVSKENDSVTTFLMSLLASRATASVPNESMIRKDERNKTLTESINLLTGLKKQ